MYRYINHISMYIYIYWGWGGVGGGGGECFLVPTLPTVKDKILFSPSYLSPNISPHLNPKRGKSLQSPILIGNIVIPNNKKSLKENKCLFELENDLSFLDDVSSAYKNEGTFSFSP